MKLHRIRAILLHTWYHLMHSFETWVDLFLNAIVQIAVFSFIAVSLSLTGRNLQGLYIIVGMIFWNVIWVGQYAVTIGPMWEIWSRSLSSMFISPLKLSEFIFAQMLSSVLKALFAVILSSGVAFALYSFSPLELGWVIVPYSLVLLLFSWGIGMSVMALIFRYGTDVQSLSWFLVFLVQPVGAVFYPVSVLPTWLQPVSYLFPTAYVFEMIRAQLRGEPMVGDYILKAVISSIVFFVLGAWLLSRNFTIAKRDGLLARMLT